VFLHILEVQIGHRCQQSWNWGI